MKHHKYVYFFGNGKAAGDPSMKRLLGGKGANLAGMTASGIPVPPGFTVSTEVCYYFNKNNNTYPAGLQPQIDKALQWVEECHGAKFGDSQNPLLVSVRSGAERSMPGMMDTVLNLGLNHEIVEGLAKISGNPRMAWDSYRRLIDMFGDVVMGVSHEYFEKSLTAIKKKAHANEDCELTTEHLKELVKSYLQIYENHVGSPFPQNPHEQLRLAIKAVFESWGKDKAVSYRKINKITGLLGTAVNVQAMVFGNMGEDSGSGVAFTRNPATGENEFYGEFLDNAQGEDVVAGIRTPMTMKVVQEKWPQIYQQLLYIRNQLEQRFRDMQDIEFTIQQGKLYMLQTRTGQRTGMAAIRMAIDMVHEHLIDVKEALKRINGDHVAQLLYPVLDPEAKSAAIKDDLCLGVGLPAGPGAASGKVVLNPKDAEMQRLKGERVILVRRETSPEDVSGMWAAEGILTSRGGMTSHAAVVARGWGKCCVVGLDELNIDYESKTCEIKGKVFKEGDDISLDGFSGELLLGKITTSPSPVISGLLHNDVTARQSQTYHDFEEIMGWTEKFKSIAIRTNVDTPQDAADAVKLGAEGIGLVRTEHMFFESDRLWVMREFIVGLNEVSRKKALGELRKFQQEDFSGIFLAMAGRPVTIRLLDPPLHEFLPQNEEGYRELSDRLAIPVEKSRELVETLRETNPMLGHRGCRLSVSYPELCRMQTEAIIQAAMDVSHTVGDFEVEIMIPLVGNIKEFQYLANIIHQTAENLFKQHGKKIQYKLGTMIETPRSALIAGKLAEEAEFFSFGTNDLTQMCLGISRDDAATFLPIYLEKRIFTYDPFERIDTEGVGELMKMATRNGRQSRANIKIGICGEHGGEPFSVKFFHNIGLDYVSCSPFRLPIARLAAAQAAIEEMEADTQRKEID